MPLLELPEPFDFELSTERFRAFGPDRANLWHDGRLHRVAGGREVRIEAAPGGVAVEPLDAETEPPRARVPARALLCLRRDRARPRRARDEARGLPAAARA